jgi:hypothetical protein
VSGLLVFAVLPVVVTFLVLGSGLSKGPFLYDYKGGLYEAGKDIVQGRNPYRPTYLEQQASVKRAGGRAETVISVPVYPASPLVAAVPFSFLPYRVAGVLFALLSIGAVLGGLRLLGVRDWRCYGVSFLSWPVASGLMLGALTPLLVLGAAAAWRFRARVWPVALAIAAVVSAKLFPWPLAVWLLATRRIRAFVVATVVALGGNLAAWAAIGFDGLRDYPNMLSNLSFVSEDAGVSVVAGLIALGVSAVVAQGAAFLLAGGLLVAAEHIARRPDGDHRAYGIVVIAALVASPMVWPHYLALLFLPIALVSPTLSWLWFTPLLAYPVAQTTGRPWVIALYLAIIAAPLVRLLPSPAARIPWVLEPVGATT